MNYDTLRRGLQLSESYYELSREWVYKWVPPRIIVEQFIDDGSGEAPSDYKFFVFDGRARLITVHSQRFTNRRIDFFTPEWKRLPVADLDFPNSETPLPEPARLHEMIRMAELLGEGMDFVRVDLYLASERIYVGELTTTPGGGQSIFQPLSFDRALGEWWRLPSSVRHTLH